MKIRFLALALAGASMSATAQAEWWEARSNHFVVFNEGSEKDTKDFATTLERFDNSLRILQNLPVGEPVPETAKVTVYRYGRTSDIGVLAGYDGVAGFYIPRAANPVAFSPAREDRVLGSFQRVDKRLELSPLVVLFHEYTHHFMLRNFNAAYPSWYVEGFAEVNSTLELRDDGSFVVGKPANHRSAELFRMNQISVRRLLDPTNRVDTVEEQLSKYSLGWLLIHYLTFDQSRQGQLVRYLDAVGKGENSLVAAERIFGDLGNLERELTKYKSSNLPGVVVGVPQYTPPKVTLRKLTPEESDLMRERIFLARGVTRKKAAALEDGLSTKAQAEPGNFTAQILASEAALDSRRYANAIAAADRAIAIAPDSMDAHVFKARALIENPDGDPERFAEARKILGTAHSIDETDPRPLIETYNSWRKQGVAIPVQGILALEAAFPLAAQDDTYRLLLTRQLLEEKKYDLGVTVIAPLAYSFDGSDPKKDVPTLVLAAVNDEKYDEALSLLNKEIAKRSGDGDT